MRRTSKRRAIIGKTEALKAQRNEVSKSVPARKKAGEDVTALFEEMKRVSEQIKALDAELGEIDAQLQGILLSTPNVPLPGCAGGQRQTAPT